MSTAEGHCGRDLVTLLLVCCDRIEIAYWVKLSAARMQARGNLNGYSDGHRRLALYCRNQPSLTAAISFSSWVPASTYPLSMSLKVAKSTPSQDGPRTSKGTGGDRAGAACCCSCGKQSRSDVAGVSASWRHCARIGKRYGRTRSPAIQTNLENAKSQPPLMSRACAASSKARCCRGSRTGRRNWPIVR